MANTVSEKNSQLPPTKSQVFGWVNRARPEDRRYDALFPLTEWGSVPKDKSATEHALQLLINRGITRGVMASWIQELDYMAALWEKGARDQRAHALLLLARNHLGLLTQVEKDTLLHLSAGPQASAKVVPFKVESPAGKVPVKTAEDLKKAFS